MGNIQNLNDIDNIYNNFNSLGNPINRFKLSFSNFPFLQGKEADEKLYMLIENNVKNFEFPEHSFTYIEDDVQGYLNLIPDVKYSLGNYNENNLTVKFMLDEFRFNYMMFFQWRTALIRKFRNISETEYVESNNEYFIDNIVLDILDNQGNPTVIYSLTFYNVALLKLGSFNSKTDSTDFDFDVTFRYEDLKFNIEKMNILKAFRNINNTKKD